MSNEETKKQLKELIDTYAEYKALYIQHMGGIMMYDEKSFHEWFTKEVMNNATPVAESENTDA
tara:strand:+ start:313 stop:501 length:189 start_codon:yes stop_codon:yes gene_type:complete